MRETHNVIYCKDMLLDQHTLLLLEQTVNNHKHNHNPIPERRGLSG